MTDYVVIADAEVEPEAPIIASLGVRLRDNAIATAEGSDGAPVVAAGWHPYNLSNVGGSADGEIYSFGTDGAVASVETPNFEDGYEYAIFFDRIQSSATSDLIIEGFKDTDASYQSYWTSGDNVGSGADWSGGFRVDFPRVTKVTHGITFIIPPVHETAGVFAIPTGDGYIQDITPQTIGKARLRFDVGNINAGAIYLWRRREYASG